MPLTCTEVGGAVDFKDVATNDFLLVGKAEDLDRVPVALFAGTTVTNVLLEPTLLEPARPYGPRVETLTYNETLIFEQLDDVFDGFAVKVRFAGDEAWHHFVEKHIHSSTKEFRYMFHHTFSDPIAVVRNDEGMWFFTRKFVDFEEFRTDMCHGFATHPNMENNALLLPCRKIEATVFDVNKNFTSVVEYLPIFPQLKQWACDISAWARTQ